MVSTISQSEHGFCLTSGRLRSNEWPLGTACCPPLWQTDTPGPAVTACLSRSGDRGVRPRSCAITLAHGGPPVRAPLLSTCRRARRRTPRRSLVATELAFQSTFQSGSPRPHAPSREARLGHGPQVRECEPTTGCFRTL